MKTIAIFLEALALLLIAAPLFAQDRVPRLELFGGVSYLPADGDDYPRNNSLGFQASLTGNLNRWFGIVGDLGGHYSRNASVYQYLAGPRFTKRTERANVFFHVLAGSAMGRTSLCVTCRFARTGFTLAGGGGLDVPINARITFRAVQLDYIGSFQEMLETNARAGLGIVIKFGER
jgi:hypothetical protein